MISYCWHPKALPPLPLPTQGHIFNEKALELCHWKQELVFLIQIIKSKKWKGRTSFDAGGEKRGNLTFIKGYSVPAAWYILHHISFNSHTNPVEQWFPDLSASKYYWACSWQIQRWESHLQTFCIWLSGETVQPVFLTLTSGVSNDQASLESPAINCNLSPRSYRCGDWALPDP